MPYWDFRPVDAELLALPAERLASMAEEVCAQSYMARLDELISV